MNKKTLFFISVFLFLLKHSVALADGIKLENTFTSNAYHYSIHYCAPIDVFETYRSIAASMLATWVMRE